MDQYDLVYQDPRTIVLASYTPTTLLVQQLDLQQDQLVFLESMSFDVPEVEKLEVAVSEGNVYLLYIAK